LPDPRLLLYTASVSRSRTAWLPILLAALAAGAVSAQDDAEPEARVAETEAEPWAGAEGTRALDIAGAGYYELIAWVRALGLPETGGADQLRSRLYSQYGIQAPAAGQAGDSIRIEAADRTEYFKLDAPGEEYVRLSGGVVLTYTEGDSGTTHRIRADEILYNRTTNLLAARGAVDYEKSGPSGTETFYGSSITVDLDSWEGRFLDGRSVRSSGEGAEESDLVFAADEIRKLKGGVLSLRDGLITSSRAEDPYWSVRASRIWLLSENEWAIANAVLSVGNVPVLYLPFFYYPGQEIVFHPAIGYRTREGRFLQTTTYLVGEKAESSGDDFNLFKTVRTGPGYEKELRGVFLRETNRPRTEVPRDNLKLLADVYSNLGAFLGVEGTFQSLGGFRDLKFSLGLGLSRSLFASGGYYTPFTSAGDFRSVWNESTLWGVVLPFRYSLNLDTKLALGPLTAAVTLPLASDPFFDQDFRNRSEDMNWLKLMSGDAPATATGETSSFTQRLSLSGAVPVPGLAPWIGALTLDRLTISLYWKPILRATPVDPDEATLFAVDPLRKFFAPELFTIADLALTIRGELLGFSGTPSAAPDPARGSSAGAGAGTEAPASGLPEPEPPWAAEVPEPAGNDGAPSDDGRGGDAVLGSSGPEDWTFKPPPASPDPAASRAAGLSGGLSYSISPSAQFERRYPTAFWDEPADVVNEGLYDLAGYRLAASLDARTSWASDVLSSSLTLAWNSQAQVRSGIDPDITHVSAAQRDAWAVQDARYRYERVTGTLKLTSFPLREIWLLAPTSLSYTLTGYLYNTVYREGSAPGVPVYDVFGPDWSTDTIKVHSLAATLGVRPYGYEQSLTLTTTLPPRLESYGLDLKANLPYAIFQGTTKYYRPVAGADFLWDALTLRATLGPAEGPTLTDQFVWNTEQGYAASNTASFAWGGFRASLAARRSQAFELIPGSGWQAVGAEELRLSEAAASYRAEADLGLSRDGSVRFKGSMNAQFSQSLLKATESVLALTYGLTLSVPGILDVEIAGTSQNSSVWRYAPDWFGMSGLGFEPVNVLADLWNSVSLWDPAALRSAQFKLKGLSVKATHYMEDWDLVFEYKGGPELITTSTPYVYEFISSFSLFLTWKAIPQITTSVVKDKEGFRTK